jgi:hypothetical protein
MKKFSCILFLFLFTLLNIQATTLNLSWPANDPSEGIASYNIYSSTNGSPYALLANTTGTSYQIPNIPNGIYGFRISAVNLAGEGTTSISITTPGLPSGVAGFNSTAVGADITLGWTTNDPGELVSGYNVYISTNGLPLVLSQTVSGPPVTYTGLDTGSYSFRISALNLAGEGPTSAAVGSPGLPSQVGSPSLTITP